MRRSLDFVTNVAGEMGNHLVADEFVRAHAYEPHAVLIAVASDNQLCLGNLGRVDVHVTIHGKPAHSSDPSRGINALNGARIFLNHLAEVEVDRVDPQLGQASLAAVFLETLPRASHTIPARAAITLDRRLLPGDDIPEAIAQIEACARDLEGCRAEVTAGHFNYPNKVDPEAEVARLTRQAMREVGLPDEVIYKRSALDGGYFTRSGADCVVFGPGDPRLGHSDEEWVALRHVEQAAEVYVRLLEKMCL
jgi:acetylornithine deacetylase/succinyl-diaminopimelate desuccinylase-like protein